VVGDVVGAGVGGAVVGTFVGVGVTVCCGVAVRRGDGVAAGVGERFGLRRAGRGVGDPAGAWELVRCVAAESLAVPGGLTHR
jgi:hypothetical protein